MYIYDLKQGACGVDTVLTDGEKDGSVDANLLTSSDILRRKSGLYLSDGGIYGGAGKAFLRMNLACPRDILMDGLERLKSAVST